MLRFILEYVAHIIVLLEIAHDESHEIINCVGFVPLAERVEVDCVGGETQRQVGIERVNRHHQQNSHDRPLQLWLREIH